MNTGASNSVRMEGLFRVNTDISAGGESLATVADKAVRKHLDFIVVSDQFLVEAEYGLPPFRNVLKVYRTRKSVSTFGVDNYLALIKSVSASHPSLVIVPGADVAPHYFWTGNPVSGLTIQQFSRQLTVFGSDDPAFYKKMPVIHNEPSGVFFPHTPLALLPLLLVLFGAVSFFRKKVFYRDAQGNEYAPPKRRFAKIASLLAIVVGVLWTINNKPFTSPGFDQYADNGRAACQRLITYAREHDGKRGSRVGVFWSAPEAESKQKMAGVTLITRDYVDDMLGTAGYDGFAGIYADTSTERYPNSFWDRLLLEFLSGKRHRPPFMVGERDYHGQGRAELDYIKTVVWVAAPPSSGKRPDAQAVSSAIIDGHSYAVCKQGGNEITLKTVELVGKNHGGATTRAIPGGTLVSASGEPVFLKITGELKGDAGGGKSLPPADGTVLVVVDGAKMVSLPLKTMRFSLEIPIPNAALSQKGRHYIRFNIESNRYGRVVCNPIFHRTR